MSFLLSRLALLGAAVVVALAHPASAKDPATPAQVAQKFYDGYLKQNLAADYVTKSKLVHPKFKKAYEKYMNGQPEFDPVIAGQDTPEGGFVASDEKFGGDTATVVMRSRTRKPKHDITIHFILEGDDQWLISGVENWPKYPRPE